MQEINNIITVAEVKNLIISGLGGMGKSELVLFYIENYKINFDNIVWINAESEQAFKSSFYDLAAKLKLEPTKETPFEVVVKSALKKLTCFGKKIVYIFDNADELLPREILPKEFENCFFFITSRHNDWTRYKKAKIIHLEALTQEEAVQFVQNSFTNFQINENEEDIKRFVAMLECFPLALKQAVSYVKWKKTLSINYTFNNYLSEFESNFITAKNLLKYISQDVTYKGEITSRDKVASTFNTWHITLDNIQKMFYSDNHAVILEKDKWHIIFYVKKNVSQQ